jgi:putative nucleotidyltransferase with HDIG domain
MISLEFFKSRFAYRIFLLFILCAAIPLLLLAFISFYRISSELVNTAQDRLHHQALNTGMSVIERLVLAEAEIDLVSAYFLHDRNDGLKEKPAGLGNHFFAMAMTGGDGAPVRDILGHGMSWPVLGKEQKAILGSGKALVFTRKENDQSAGIFLCKNVKDPAGKEITIMGKVSPSFLLGIYPGQESPFGTAGISILEKGSLVFTTLSPAHRQELLRMMNRSGSLGKGRALVNLVGSEFLFSSVPVFLESRIKAPLWTLVLIEPKSSVFAPVKDFKITFVLIIALTFVIVLFLSTVQIRRHFVPLELLQKGTQRISRGDFRTSIRVESGDEFEDLARSFNTMAVRIDEQFKTLRTMEEIDRAILSEFDFEKIIETFVGHISHVCPCETAGITFRYLNSDERWMTYYHETGSDGFKCNLEVFNLDREDLVFQDKPSGLVHVDSEHLPEYLTPLVKLGMKTFLVLPMLIKNQLMAFAFLGKHTGDFDNTDLLLRARQISDQVAVAFSNAYLIKELNLMNWGTLTALARVVDAKSPWTAGHSERVSAMAFRIGEAMGLDANQLDMISKAGMLHDIGKVSTPRSILDKKGKLTSEEFEIIRKHPGNGARILEPIIPYSGMVPIVLQHHERFDGKGYPGKLMGSDITIGARIMAVADSFDAMTSDRPYRAGRSVREVLEEIDHQSGRQFDPEVVRAFLKVMGTDDLKKECA